MKISHAVTSADAVRASAISLFLHGFGSHERDLVGLAQVLPQGVPWISPRGPLDIGGGAAWFPIVEPGNPAPDVLHTATDALWAWIDENVSPQAKLIPIGFSQGGLMVSQLLRTRPERVLAIGVLSGFVQAAEQPADEQLSRDLPPAFWGHGSADPVITAAAVERTATWLPAHTTLTEKIYPAVAHTIVPAEIHDLKTFLADLPLEVA